MRSRDPKCVFVTDRLSVADVVVNSLSHQGITAEVMNRLTLGGLLGLTIWSSTGVSAEGIEVWVHDVKDVPRALQVIAEGEERRQQLQRDKAELGPVDAKCEECGQATTFPGKQRGTVQDCPHCGAYMDVPGDEASFDWQNDAEDPGDGA